MLALQGGGLVRGPANGSAPPTLSRTTTTEGLFQKEGNSDGVRNMLSGGEDAARLSADCSGSEGRRRVGKYRR